MNIFQMIPGWCGFDCYLVVEVFILKLLPVDALAPGAIMVGEVASLDHELLDNCQKHIYSHITLQTEYQP